jgi:hypothetical protein
MNRLLSILPRFIVAIVSLGLSAEAADADTVTNFPVADTGLQKANPTLNFGSSLDLVSGGLGSNSGFDVRRILLKFDFSGQIPPQAVINSATLTVNVIDHLPGGGTGPDSTFGLRRVLQDWSETEATWNNWSSLNAWNSPGAAGAGDSISAASSTVFVSGLGSYVFPSTAALVADAQDWVASPGTNFGWLLMNESEAPQTARHFASREDPVNTPYIVVDYSLPPPALVISGCTLVGGLLRFSFNAQSNQTYGIQFRSFRTGEAWSTLTNFAAQPLDTVITFSEPLTSSNRCYRVRTP